MTTIICPHCGKDTLEDAAICPHCGMQLEPSPAEKTGEAITPEAAPAKKPTPVWWKVVRCLFSIPLTVLLIVALISTITLSAARNITQKNTIASLFNEIDPTAVVAEVLTEGETDEFAAVIYDTYEQAAIENGMEEVLTQDELQEFLDQSTLDEFLTDKTSAYLSAFFGGDDTAVITKEELLDLVEDNEEIITEVTGGYELTAEDYAMLEQAIDESGIVEQLDMTELLADSDPAVTDTLQMVYHEAFYAAIGLCVLLLLLLALFNLRGYYLTSLYSGIALLLAGGIASLTLALETFAVEFIASANLPLSREVLSAVVNTVLSGFWIPGLCLVGAGTLCIVFFAVMRILRRHRNEV